MIEMTILGELGKIFTSCRYCDIDNNGSFRAIVQGVILMRGDIEVELSVT